MENCDKETADRRGVTTHIGILLHIQAIGPLLCNLQNLG